MPSTKKSHDQFLEHNYEKKPFMVGARFERYMMGDTKKGY